MAVLTAEYVQCNIVEKELSSLRWNKQGEGSDRDWCLFVQRLQRLTLTGSLLNSHRQFQMNFHHRRMQQRHSSPTKLPIIGIHQLVKNCITCRHFSWVTDDSDGFANASVQEAMLSPLCKSYFVPPAAPRMWLSLYCKKCPEHVNEPAMAITLIQNELMLANPHLLWIIVVERCIELLALIKVFRGCGSLPVCPDELEQLRANIQPNDTAYCFRTGRITNSEGAVAFPAPFCQAELMGVK